MDESAKAVKKRDLRRKRVGKSRQDSLVIDYISVKYADIYQEGVQFYESINKNHSTKHDLRKTEEYKAWKASMIRIKESTPESQSATPEPEPRPLQSQPATSDPEPQHVYEDNFQLQIPLMHYEKAPVIPEGSSNHTLQSITQETLDEDTLYPSLEDQITPELIEKIMEELRQEPCLHDVFTDIEQQVEFEQLGMDIDITEDYPLEKELAQW